MTGIDVIPYAVAEHMAAEMTLNMLGWGWIRAGHRILCTYGTGRSAGRRWPGPLAFSMHAEVSPWLMYLVIETYSVAGECGSAFLRH